MKKSCFSNVLICLTIFLTGCLSEAEKIPSTSTLSFSATSAQTKLPPTETLTPTITPVPSSTPRPLHPVSAVVKHDPDGQTGYTWFSYVPRSLQKNKPVTILLDAGHGQVYCNDDEAKDETRRFVESYAAEAYEHGYILLLPVIPQECGKDNVWYTLHFADSTFTAPIDARYFRPDLRVNAMLDELTSILEQDGFDVNNKAYVFGFSIGGHFANRYALLQPNRVAAFAAGGLSGELSLPVESIDDINLKWYLGVQDYEQLTGKPFDSITYGQIPQLYFWGEEDQDHYHLDGKCTDWGGMYCQYYDFSGTDSAEALRTQCGYLESLNIVSDIVCREDPDVGHEFTREMQKDVFDYFDSLRDRE